MEDEFNSSFSSTESMSNIIVSSKYLAKKSNFMGESVMYFLMEMNYIALHELSLKNTFFDSPHGLSNYKNYSSA